MKCVYRLILLLGAAAFALTLVAAAQTDFLTFVKTADVPLDEDQVREAAAPLIDRDIRVGVYMVMQGSQSDFLKRLRQDGLGDGQQADHDVIAIYVSSSPQYSEIRWGQTYNRQLEPVGRDLRSTQLNAYLRQSDYTAAFVHTLGALDDALSGTYVSSGAAGSSSSAPSIEFEDVLPFLLIAGLIGVWIYCLLSGRCRSSSTSYDSSYSSSSDFSSGSSSSGGSSDGYDGGSWND